MSQAFTLDGLRATPHALYYKGTYDATMEEGYFFYNGYGGCSYYNYADGSYSEAEMW
jgi:hypothetical protein